MYFSRQDAAFRNVQPEEILVTRHLKICIEFMEKQIFLAPHH